MEVMVGFRGSIFQKRDGYQEEEDTADSDRSSSSIGVPDDSDEEGEGEVTSEAVVAKEGFRSLASLDDSLPVKRGLSNHFSGKSKSFTNLSEAIASTSAKEIEKTEHPFNKKRRILRWSKKNLAMLPSAVSMPLLPVSGNSESFRDNDEDDHYHDQEGELPTPRSVFKSYSCFALADLREEDEDDCDDDE